LKKNTNNALLKKTKTKNKKGTRSGAAGPSKPGSMLAQ